MALKAIASRFLSREQADIALLQVAQQPTGCYTPQPYIQPPYRNAPSRSGFVSVK